MGGSIVLAVSMHSELTRRGKEQEEIEEEEEV